MICYVILGIFPATSALLAQLLIIVVLVSNGVGFVGLARNAQVVSLLQFRILKYVLNDIGHPKKLFATQSIV